MRSYQLVKQMTALGQDIQTILEYLALNKKHFVSYNIVDPMGRIMTTNNVSMENNVDLILTVIFNDGSVSKSKGVDLNLRLLQAIRLDSEKKPPSDEYLDTFANKWEEIKSVAELNVGANLLEKYR